MANPDPCPGNRWPPGHAPNPGGRPKRAWIRKRLGRRNAENASELDQILDHQIEVAKSWEVRIVGRDENGTPIKVASGRDSTEAAKFLYGLIGLRPIKEGDDLVKLPPGVVVDHRDLLDVAMDIYRARLSAGQMSESELSDMVRTLLTAEREKALIFLKALGSKLQALQGQQVNELVAKYEANPMKFLGMAKDVAAAPAPNTPPAPVEPAGSGDLVSAGQTESPEPGPARPAEVASAFHGPPPEDDDEW